MSRSAELESKDICTSEVMSSEDLKPAGKIWHGSKPLRQNTGTEIQKQTGTVHKRLTGIQNINVSEETSSRPKQTDPSTRIWTTSPKQPLKPCFLSTPVKPNKDFWLISRACFEL